MASSSQLVTGIRAGSTACDPVSRRCAPGSPAIPDGALEPGVQRAPDGGEQPGLHQGPPSEIDGVLAERPRDDVPGQQRQEHQGERDVQPQRLDPRNRARHSRRRADPGGEGADGQRGEPDGQPSARPSAAHAAGDDRALARDQRDHDESDDAVHDRDPRAPRRPRRLCRRTGDEGEREDAEQGQVGRPPRPRPGPSPHDGAHAISHLRSRRRLQPGRRREPGSRAAGRQDQPLYAAAFRVAACSLSQLLSVDSRRSR